MGDDCAHCASRCMPEKCECGMPLDKKSACSCQPDKCIHCCSCDDECDCGCKDKAKEAK